MPARVDGLEARPAFLHPEAHLPRRRLRARALLSPFDSLIWERQRTERLWDFRYRIEIYTPQPKRVHGYYVLPFLLDEALVGRVDLKADRQAGVLRVQAAWASPRACWPPPADATGWPPSWPPSSAPWPAWLGLPDGVDVEPRGDLAPDLAAAVAAVARGPTGWRRMRPMTRRWTRCPAGTSRRCTPPSTIPRCGGRGRPR